MGCFTVLKCKKKKIEQPINVVKIVNPPETTPTTLPEPQTTKRRSLQSAPPSFRTRAKPVQSASHHRTANSRIRALSAPSSLHVAERDALAAMDYDEQEESRGRGGSVKEQLFPNPQPLPLPSPQGTAVLRNMGSFKSTTASGPLSASGPLPLPPVGGLRNFSYDEIAAACQHISPDRWTSEGFSTMVYRASFGDDASGSKKLDATVTRLLPSNQVHSRDSFRRIGACAIVGRFPIDLFWRSMIPSHHVVFGLNGYSAWPGKSVFHSAVCFRDFVNEVNTLATLQHPQLCKLLGFHAREGSDHRMLVYERLYHGSLDRLLYGHSDGPPVDWCARMKVALCAAQGLAFLHEEGPFQAMYNEFSAANIQVDKDFSSKLSGYGCVSHSPDPEIASGPVAVANLSVETLEGGLLTPKSNVWSFGIVLLELLTGRKNLDTRHPKEERDLLKWSRLFLADDSRLSLIIDPRLKGRVPSKAARAIADLALKCLQKDRSERPTMRSIVESLKNIQDIKYSCWFPLQEPATAAGKQMLRSPSLNGVTQQPSRSSFSPSPPSKIRPPFSPTRPPSLPIPLPPRTCSSTVTLEDIRTEENRKNSEPLVRRPGVEGF
ncbi:hypothetical protein ACLOJK_031457 [Asimina triloba]